jgi:hypothetical protein
MDGINLQTLRRHYEKQKNGQLAPPLDEDEVEKTNPDLPRDLFVYLTKVSAEICVSQYPIILQLSCLKADGKEDTEGRFYERERWEQVRNSVYVGNHGCDHHDELDMRTGKVYSGSTEYLHLIAESFREYVVPKTRTGWCEDEVCDPSMLL